MKAEIYILSHERPELLACTLASVCGYNADVRPVYIVDDASQNPAVHALLDSYKAAGLIDGWYKFPKRGGVGQIRRKAIDLFLEGRADYMVQVESDMLIGQGQIKTLLDSYAAIRNNGFPGLHWLNTYWHTWVRPCKEIIAAGGCRVGVTRGGSEPLWVTDRASLRKAVSEGLVPASRPDLVLWLDKYDGATLLTPEIQAQHLGAGPPSIYYPTFAWQNVVFHDQNEARGDGGPLRQPFPFLKLDFPAVIRDYPASILSIHETLRAHSPWKLPEYAHAG